MTNQLDALISGPSGGLVSWLAWGAVGPAAAALPVNWAADKLADAAVRWFKRLRKTDDLSRLVTTATGTSIDLSGTEFRNLRKLLESEDTWKLLAGHKVTDLSARIATCLSPCDGRTAEDSAGTAGFIARGLLEFAVFDLEPENFQKVVLARLQQMTDHATELDKALLGLHSDLYARLDGAMELLKRTLEQQPGTAGRGEIAIYLRTLIAWLNKDQWPEDRQLRGPTLTPAAIERKLRITPIGGADKMDHDADDLAKQCHRLVILGGPGSGKTWLAKRIARRCAEEALEALTAGGSLDEVELPLYTTCSQLFRLSAAGDGIREAVVSSALNQIDDLGGSRLTRAVHDFFAERKNWSAGQQSEPTLLVIDSLDEASGPDDPLRQADKLPWRIVLTSRPIQWNRQLIIEEGNDSHRVGELQPLRYPDDVESFIKRWFERRPELGSDLAEQLAWRPGLQQAATVPLILAFYCIIGGGESLPDFMHELYTKVLTRMLRGYWHGSRLVNRNELHVSACLQTLQAWAWSGASGAGNNHPVSGVGMWADDIPTPRCELSEADAEAVDHVALPLGLPDVDDIDAEETLRHFIHRSIREHLVAKHVATWPVDDAVNTLLPHLWHDSDWEYAVPAAIAIHPQRDQLLRDLTQDAAHPHPITQAGSVIDNPDDLSAIDGGWQVRGLLARVAAQSGEADWSPEVAALIDRARVDLARSGRVGDLVGAVSWQTSNRHAREALLELLAPQTEGQAVGTLVDGVVRLAHTAEDKRQAREALLELLDRTTDGFKAQALVPGVIRLAHTGDDKRQAREALLRVLDHTTDGFTAQLLVRGVAQLDPTAEDDRQAWERVIRVLADQAGSWGARYLVDDAARLASAAANKGQAREVLLGLLSHAASDGPVRRLADVVIQLASSAEDERQAREVLLGRLGYLDDPSTTQWVIGRVAQLAPAGEDRRQALEALLGRLMAGNDSRTAQALADGVVQLASSKEDKLRAREVLLWMLATQPNWGWTAEAFADAAARLDLTPEDKCQGRDALLGMLASRAYGPAAEQLAASLLRLDPTAEDKRRARDALVRWLADADDDQVAAALAAAIARLDPTAEERGQVREALVSWLVGRHIDPYVPYGIRLTRELADTLVRLAPAAEEKHEAMEALLTLLANAADVQTAQVLADGVVRLALVAEEKPRAREALLGLLAGATDGSAARLLADRVLRLDPTEQDKGQVREALVALLASLTHGPAYEREPGSFITMYPGSDDERRIRKILLGPVGVVIQLDPTVRGKDQALEALLRWLADPAEDWQAQAWVAGVVQLATTERSKHHARATMLGLLAGEAKDWAASALINGVAQLDPTIQDLSGWRTWAVPPTAELLAGVRRNSALAVWLEALPSLAPLSG